MESMADAFFRSVSHGCIAAASDADIDRRPYHKNCTCALHDRDNNNKRCSNANHKSVVSYPIRRAWSESCLASISGSGSSGSAVSSPCYELESLGSNRR